MGNFWDKSFRENQNTLFIFENFYSKNHAIYDVMWKNVVQLDRLQKTVWRMRIACWITKATNTHAEYVIHIAFPLQQWLQERALLLNYTNTACLVRLVFT
jgi:hypothetical protein